MDTPDTSSSSPSAEAGAAVFEPSTGYLVWQLGHALGARLERALRDLDLTLAQHNALQHAIHRPGVTSAESARRTGVTAQSMGSAVADLTARGLLERRPHPTNRRMIGLHPTEAGARLAARAKTVVENVNAEALAVLTPPEQATAHLLLHRLITHLNPDALRLPS
ncbi:MarR family transcriptional regulator [Streptomyces sp. MST-110588]|uniref:MarR family winged helix-turn-helix transcriptional regulator n=1 Tax=Streptomyces sp. MST-110588 TaxID=2833628 RepID=UPI001F5D4A1C|nr:MarR family transcriptional regulator [Streptomyces sp. MST-110588]UNO41047.1 MarR family transcriptional regulator [Streptomyces sp. MST-110588]